MPATHTAAVHPAVIYLVPEKPVPRDLRTIAKRMDFLISTKSSFFAPRPLLWQILIIMFFVFFLRVIGFQIIFEKIAPLQIFNFLPDDYILKMFNNKINYKIYRNVCKYMYKRVKTESLLSWLITLVRSIKKCSEMYLHMIL